MEGVCSIQEGTRIVCNYLTLNLRDKRQLASPRHGWEYNIKMRIWETECEVVN
jgi:hypothetical protein